MPTTGSLVHVAEDLATDVLTASLLVIQNTRGRGLSEDESDTYRHTRMGDTHEDEDTELTRREQQVDPVLDLVDLNVVAGGDDASLVEAAVELDDYLARTVVIDNLERADVA